MTIFWPGRVLEKSRPQPNNFSSLRSDKIHFALHSICPLCTQSSAHNRSNAPPWSTRLPRTRMPDAHASAWRPRGAPPSWVCRARWSASLGLPTRAHRRRRLHRTQAVQLNRSDLPIVFWRAWVRHEWQPLRGKIGVEQASGLSFSASRRKSPFPNGTQTRPAEPRRSYSCLGPSALFGPRTMMTRQLSDRSTPLRDRFANYADAIVPLRRHGNCRDIGQLVRERIHSEMVGTRCRASEIKSMSVRKVAGTQVPREHGQLCCAALANWPTSLLQSVP